MKHIILKLLDHKYSIFINIFEDKYHPYSELVLKAVFAVITIETLYLHVFN